MATAKEREEQSFEQKRPSGPDWDALHKMFMKLVMLLSFHNQELLIDMFVFFSQQFGDEVWITVTVVITAR